MKRRSTTRTVVSPAAKSEAETTRKSTRIKSQAKPQEEQTSSRNVSRKVPASSKSIQKSDTAAKNKSVKKPTKIKIKKGSFDESKDDGGVFEVYEKEKAYLCQLLDGLINENQSNSIIISGDAGVGKSSLVEGCISKYPELSQSNGTDQSRRKKQSNLRTVVFRFDGYLHGKYELSLLRQMAQKLNEFTDKNERVFVDDLEDDFDGHEDDETDYVNLKANNAIPKIIKLFRTLIENNPNFRAVIILDQFDRFCTKQQHLLYNLFDLIQYGKGIFIIGITRVIESHQLLVSRVQSRMNQRYIHLFLPLDTFDKYKAFCMHQVKFYRKKDPTFFEGSYLESQAFIDELKKSYSCKPTFADAKVVISEQAFLSKTIDKKVEMGPILLDWDAKIMDLMNLNKNELIILLIANKRLKNMDEEQFNCKELFEWTTLNINMRNFKFAQLIKSIYLMLESDLIIYAKQFQTKTQLALTPWTKLKLNISDFQLKDIVQNMANKLPAYIKQLID